ncbi:MAG TPA: PAS domain S-box protein [Balneolales bacterium]|nr:PAS domain S-box protein [Balneolales bacterium]
MPRTEFELVLFWNSLIPISVVDAKTLKFLEINPAFMDLYGYSRETFFEMTIRDIRPSEEVERLLSYMLDDDAPSEEHLGIWMHKNKTGDILYVLQNVQKFTYHGQEALLIYSLDVTSEYVARLELEEARRLNDTLIRNLPDGFFLLNENGYVIKWNRRFEQLSGYNEDEVPGLTYRNFHEYQHLDQVEKAMKTLLDGETITMEAVFVKKDKTDVPCFYSASGFKINDKKYVIGTCRDLRSFKALEVKARKEKRRFRETFEQAAVGIAHVGLDGSWLRVNDKLCQILGYDRQELLEMDFQTVTYPDDLEADLYHVQKLIDAEMDTYTIDKRYIRKSGELIWVRLTVSSVWDGDTLEYFISVIQDITESYKLQEELKINQERLIKAQQIGKIGNWELDIQHDDLYWSDEIYRIFGIVSRDSFASNFEAFLATVHPEDREKLLKTQDAALRGEVPLNVEHRIVLPDGNIRTVFERGELRRDKEGKPISFVGTVEDITDLKETERALRQALNEKEVALGEMHHRVKNNLAVISALFTLHAESQSGLTPVEVIELIEQHIKTISRIHEEMYKSSDLSRIPILSILEKHLSNELFTEGVVKSISLPEEEIHINANQAITFFLLISETGLELNRICNKNNVIINKLSLFSENESLNIVYSLSKKNSPEVFSGIESVFKVQPIISTLMHQLDIKFEVNPDLRRVHIQFKMKDIKGSATSILN